MTRQSETGHVGHPAHAVIRCNFCTVLIQVLHLIQGTAVMLLAGKPVFLSRYQRAAPDSLGKHQLIARFGPRIGNEPAGVHGTNHGQPVFGGVVVYGMSAYNQGPGLPDLFVSSPQDLSEYFHGNLLLGKHHQVQSH